MPKLANPFSVIKRKDSKTFRLTINPTSGLPNRLCEEWYRRSFQYLPDELADYRNPKTLSAANIAAQALINYLKKEYEEGNTKRIIAKNITVDEWLQKFIYPETSPRTGINIAETGSFSEDSVDNYLSYYNCHIKGDPFLKLKMAEVEYQDTIDLSTRMSVRKLKDGRNMGGTRTFVGIIKFIRMAFKNYSESNRGWLNPFSYTKEPKYESTERDALSDDEISRLFEDGVLQRTMELAVCAAIFWSGLRRSEVFALKPEDLDWHNQIINVRRTWQNFDSKDKKKLGPTKGKRTRKTLFDPVLQAAIKRLWEENGKHEFVFSYKDGTTPGASWTRHNFEKWLQRAGIERNGRDIVPHSARHSLATFLINKNVPLRHIQELLGHSHLKVTQGYGHIYDWTIQSIGKKVEEARETEETRQNIVNFKVS